MLLYEMKFLVPNYSCLQNTWPGGYRPQIPIMSSVLNLLNPPNKIPGYATGLNRTENVKYRENCAESVVFYYTNSCAEWTGYLVQGLEKNLTFQISTTNSINLKIQTRAKQVHHLQGHSSG